LGTHHRQLGFQASGDLHKVKTISIMEAQGDRMAVKVRLSANRLATGAQAAGLGVAAILGDAEQGDLEGSHVIKNRWGP